MNALVPLPRDGEILAAASVTVLVFPHPLRLTRREMAVPAGDTIAEIVAAARAAAREAGSGFGQARVAIGADTVPEADWPRVRVRPGAIVTVRAALQKPVVRFVERAVEAISRFVAENIVQILSVVAAGAALFFAPYLAPGIASFFGIGTSVAQSLIAGGITLAGALVSNLLFSPGQPKLASTTAADQLERSPTYSLQGARNEVKPYGAIPVVLGRHRLSPPFAAQPYTEIAGADNYLRLFFCLGFGPVTVSDILIGETPLANFTGVESEIRYGYAGDAAISLFPVTAIQEDLSIELTFADDWLTRTTADDIDEISIDIEWPNGIVRYQKADGAATLYSVSIEAQYRVAGSGADWSPLGTLTEVAATLDTIRRNFRASVARGQYEVRVRRFSPEYSGEDTVIEAMFWRALRGFRNDPPVNWTGAPLAYYALRIKASAQLSGTLNGLNMVLQSRATVWNGSAWVTDTPTSNPAALFRHVLQGGAVAEPVADSRIDLDQLAAWSEYCDAEGFECNMVRDWRGSVFEALRDIAACGRGAPVWRDGRWSVVWDDPADAVVQLFTPRNSWGFNGSRVYKRKPHALRVRFLNENEGFLQDERTVYDDGYSAENATRFEALEFPGVTDPDLIWRFGRYFIAQARLRPETYTLTTTMQHLVCQRGDRVRVAHDVILVGRASARVAAVDGSTVTLDETVTMIEAEAYAIRFRQPDGTVVLRQVATVAGEGRELTLTGSGDAPEVGALVAFGVAGTETGVYRVASVRPTADLVAELTLVDDAPAIHDADTGTIPEFVSNVSRPIDPFTLPPVALAASTFTDTGQAQVRAGVRFSWSVPRAGHVEAFEVEYRSEVIGIWTPAGTAVPPQTFLRIFDLAPGTYSFRVRARFVGGDVSTWAELLNFAVNDLLEAPPDVTEFRIAVLGATATLSWSPILTEPIARYEIRWSPATSGATWGAAVPLIPSASGASAMTAFQNGTYFIKAVSSLGVYSANATSIVVDYAQVAALNAVETITEDPAFSGTRDDVTVEADELRLADAGDFFGDDGDDEFFDGLDFFLGDGFAATGTYTFAGDLDLGAVYTSRLTPVVTAYGDAPADEFFDGLDFFDGGDFFGAAATGWNVVVEFRSTDDDPAGSPTWTAWATLTLSDITARAFEFRAVLSTTVPDVTPVVTGLSVEIDMPDEVRAGEDLVVTVSGRTVSFSPAFRALKGLAIAAQDLATGDYAEITSKSATGFDILFRDAGGSPVERTFDFTAVGYGSVS